jgi:hypothetical protein
MIADKLSANALFNLPKATTDRILDGSLALVASIFSIDFSQSVELSMEGLGELLPIVELR